MDQDLILIDGTQGGGQVLRTARSSMSRCALLNLVIKGA